MTKEIMLQKKQQADQDNILAFIEETLISNSLTSEQLFNLGETIYKEGKKAYLKHIDSYNSVKERIRSWRR